MKVKKDTIRECLVVVDGANRYNETTQAEATSRVLDGSSDHGYDEEWEGYGEIDGVPVRAIYLIDYTDQGTDMDSYDWVAALESGRIEVMVDDLSDVEYDILTKTGELKMNLV